MLACEAGTVPFLAGGRASSGGFAVCLPPSPVDGTRAAKVVVSISRKTLREPRAGTPEPIQVWWAGEGDVRISVRGDEVTIDGVATLSQRTSPASFTGGHPDEPVRLVGTARLTRR